MTQDSKNIANVSLAFQTIVLFDAECAHQIGFAQKLFFLEVTCATFCTVCCILIALEFQAFKGIVGGHKGNVIFNTFLIFSTYATFPKNFSVTWETICNSCAV